RRLVPREPVPQVRQRAARARRVQRRAGERRPLARRGAPDRVLGDARLREEGRAPQTRVPPRLALQALHVVVDDPVLELAQNANAGTALGPRAARVVPDGWVLWLGRIDNPSFNVAQRFRLEPDGVERARAEIHDALRAHGRTAGCTWEVGSSATPADLVERLL